MGCLMDLVEPFGGLSWPEIIIVVDRARSLSMRPDNMCMSSFLLTIEGLLQLARLPCSTQLSAALGIIRTRKRIHWETEAHRRIKFFFSSQRSSGIVEIRPYPSMAIPPALTWGL
jgi:hypothetical protein